MSFSAREIEGEEMLSRSWVGLAVGWSSTHVVFDPSCIIQARFRNK